MGNVEARHCDPMNRSTPGLPVHHQLPEFTSTHVHRVWWCHPAISFSAVPFSSFPQSLPASGSIPMSQLFASGGQSIGVSASVSVLPMNTQDGSPLDQFKESSDIVETLRFSTWISETEAAEIVEKHTVYDIKFFDECHTAGKWWSRCRCLCVWLLSVCWPGLPSSTYILYFFAFHFFCDYHHHPL